MDRHKIWRIVRNNLMDMERESPEGFTAVVDVFIVGRVEPVRLNRVETSTEPELPWVFMTQEVPSAKAEPGDSVILVPEQYIERIEIRFVRSDETRTVGFTYGTFDEQN
jgi:hypothetical protein